MNCREEREGEERRKGGEERRGEEGGRGGEERRRGEGGREGREGEEGGSGVMRKAVCGGESDTITSSTIPTGQSQTQHSNLES